MGSVSAQSNVGDAGDSEAACSRIPGVESGGRGRGQGWGGVRGRGGVRGGAGSGERSMGWAQGPCGVSDQCQGWSEGKGWLCQMYGGVR